MAAKETNLFQVGNLAHAMGNVPTFVCDETGCQTRARQHGLDLQLLGSQVCEVLQISLS